MRKKASHKGQNGRLLVIGGSKDYVGAPYLASIAAMRLGTDLVKLAAPKNVAWAVNSLCPDLITIKLEGDFIAPKHKKTLLKAIEENDVILIGPGISHRHKIFYRSLIRCIKKPKIIDAEAIKAINLQEVKNAVITAHKGEFEALLKDSGLAEKNFRKHLKDNIILLKGKNDKIITKDKTYTNKTGNEGMTVGGTGDILAGLVSGYISQGETLLSAAKKAAKLNGKIGDKLKKELGYGFIASDFLKVIAKEAKR